jgi:hypothetical protein
MTYSMFGTEYTPAMKEPDMFAEEPEKKLYKGKDSESPVDWKVELKRCEP